MNQNRNWYLLNWPFLLGLTVLLLNDHWLKSAFHNDLTGKLSDFAGIFILPFFLKYLFRKSDYWSVYLTIILFVFWKTSLSDGFIDLLNWVLPLSFVRVIDITDFIAFSILPLSLFILQNLERYKINLPKPKLTELSIALISIIAFSATSIEEDDIFIVDGDRVTQCCAEPSQVHVVGNGTVFVPNIFTPDGNGINDFFQIIADTGIARIDTFRIWNANVDTLLYQTESITSFTPNNGWDGAVNDTIRPGQVYFQILVSSTDSVQQSIFGYLCVLPCIDPIAEPRPLNLTECIFANQFSFTDSIPDINNPSFEDLDCFE